MKRFSPRRFLSVIAAILVVIFAVWLFLHQQKQAQLTYQQAFEQAVRIQMLDEEAKTPFIDGGPPALFSRFFLAHASLPPTISPAALSGAITRGEAYILDAREDEEFAIGHFQNSRHIRYADLRVGAWKNLPADRIITVFCYSGVRGEIVTKFLRSRGIAAQSIEGGAWQWVDRSAAWQGTVDFYGHYNDPKYYISMLKQSLTSYQAQGALLIDPRPPYAFEANHLPGSQNIRLFLNPTSALDQAIAHVPLGRPIVTVCADENSCFDATILGIRMEKRGYRFLGIFKMDQATNQ